MEEEFHLDILQYQKMMPEVVNKVIYLSTCPLNCSFFPLLLKKNENTFKIKIFHEICYTVNSLKRRTRSGPALTVCLREVSTLEGDEVND